MKNKILSLLGLATRSRNLVSGEFATETSIKSKKAKLVIIASDASDNTKKQFTNMCKHYHIPLYIYSAKSELGHAIGKDYRASIAIEDEGFSSSIREKLNNELNTEV